ncbi:DUF4293 domain-containing protein [Flavobacteriaceae bacterium]|nr:DUF4293 domain-containing protein [Flavobacteriaceae bacterium]MDA9124681.1 DUF4293 domain-containing protein [Flavobacteriaceae bacterium]MDC0117361.1 DUF4293 domain-containing protein [Flavobacteriaceae bacterium]
MIQRIQSIFMFLLTLINIILLISIDSDPPSSISESYFGYYRIYITDYFFSEIISLIVLINIFLFKHSKVQIIILRILFLTMIFGLINLFDERSLETSLSDPGLIYFIISFVLIIMSIRSIKKDQVIISSSNRLR